VLVEGDPVVNEGSVIDIAVKSILLATKLSAPILGVSLAIGLFVGLIQSATQIQEQTLTFVPKLAGVALVIVITGHWMLSQIIGFTQSLFEMIPHLIAS
jgi:flagellar biosynthetic protein FliQ